jgi:hypothetical protein
VQDHSAATGAADMVKQNRHPATENVVRFMAGPQRSRAQIRGDIVEICAKARQIIAESRELMARVDAILARRPECPQPKPTIAPNRTRPESEH